MTLPTVNPTSPSEPLNFTARSLNGTIMFSWDAPAVHPFGTRYQIFSAPGSSAVVESGGLLWEGSDRSTQVNVNVTSPWWYWVRAYVSSAAVSPYTPNTIGLQLAGFAAPNNPQFTPLLNDPDFIYGSLATAWATHAASSTVANGFPGNLGGYARFTLRNNVADQNILRQAAVTTVTNGKTLMLEIQYRVNSQFGGSGFAVGRGMNATVYAGASTNSVGNLVSIIQFTASDVNSLGAWRSLQHQFPFTVSSPAYAFPIVEFDRTSQTGSGSLDIDHAQLYVLR